MELAGTCKSWNGPQVLINRGANAMKYKTERVHSGRYDAYMTDDNGEYPMRIGCITGGGVRRCWLAESGYDTLGYHKTKKDALQAIIDHRALKTSAGEIVRVIVQETQP
jgi:hypothetical protein